MARAGRKRKLDAKRRQTTRLGRNPPDLGTAQIRRLKQILNPRMPGLPADPLAALYSRGLISEASYAAGRRFGALTTIARRGWQLQEASVSDLWRRMVSGTMGDISTPRALGSADPADDEVPTTADQMRGRLARMREELWPPGEQGEIFFAVQAICVDLAWPSWLKRIVLGSSTYPGDHRHFGQVREGLHRLAELRSVRIWARAEAAE
jgi:hypothetical protein